MLKFITLPDLYLFHPVLGLVCKGMWSGTDVISYSQPIKLGPAAGIVLLTLLISIVGGLLSDRLDPTLS